MGEVVSSLFYSDLFTKSDVGSTDQQKDLIKQILSAKENNLDPKEWTEKNILVMKKQLQKLGLSVDWKREISTCDESYYKHQQKFFIELYKKGLVYRKENYVNWDPIDETVLANEQVIDGKGWK